MSDIVIKVENLSKQYRLGLIGGKTLRDDLHRWCAKWRGKPDPTLRVDQLPVNSFSGNNNFTNNQELITNNSRSVPIAHSPLPMNPIIQVRNPRKRYRIGTREQGYKC